MDLLAMISSFFPSLSKSEKKVAQLILSNPDEIEHLSINEISAMASVGESTVVRFARKIGFSGFQDLKLALAKYQATVIKKDSRESDGEKGIIYQQYVDSLAETMGFLKEDQIQKAVTSIHEARRIYIFAVGNSGLVGMNLSNRLKRLGKWVEFVQDGQLQSIYATMMTKDDLAFAISTSGNTNEVIINVEMAKSHGCKSISLTNYLGSKLTEISDLVLIGSSKEYISDAGSFAAMVNQMFIIDVLAKELVKLAPDHYHELRMKRNEALMNRIN
ncbi:MurR/RpiR family transcriptional regulator [Enterococcus sp. AZ192]|uniref:MurR/RpiR family transcriptional regulator n=1 Tax=unclassified Enterococcus TaxID=2608891 RepID=UPI003D2AE421